MVGVLFPLIFRFTEIRPISGYFSLSHSRMVSSRLFRSFGTNIFPQQVTLRWTSGKLDSTFSGLVSGLDLGGEQGSTVYRSQKSVAADITDLGGSDSGGGPEAEGGSGG